MKILLILLICGGYWATATAQEKCTAVQFQQKLSKRGKIKLIDVRTPEEYAEGHIAKSTLVNYKDEKFKEQLKNLKLNKKKPVFVYCRSGNRSGKAAQILKEMGFKKIYDLEGGVISWEQSGFQLIK
jgi:thioredoxin 1